MKKIFLSTLIFIFAVAACAPATEPPTQVVTAPPTEAPTEPPTEVPSEEPQIASRLAELGGTPCEENPDFTCVTIPVPLDHFDVTNIETIDVVFAVSPASGERHGMFVQAFPGGPSKISCGSAVKREIQRGHSLVVC